jgi:hypothetical protein
MITSSVSDLWVVHHVCRYTSIYKISLSRSSLKMCAQESGIDYRHTAVNWAKSIRNVFTEYVYRNILNHENPMQFTGTVEIDGSLFGRKITANRGSPRNGERVWIMGLVERATTRIIPYVRTWLLSKKVSDLASLQRIGDHIRTSEGFPCGSSCIGTGGLGPQNCL